MVGRRLDKEAAAILAALGGEERVCRMTGGKVVGLEHQNGFVITIPQSDDFEDDVCIELEADLDAKTFSASLVFPKIQGWELVTIKGLSYSAE